MSQRLKMVQTMKPMEPEISMILPFLILFSIDISMI